MVKKKPETEYNCASAELRFSKKAKVHSFLKQCLYDLWLTDKGDTFTKPFSLNSAEIS